jgi:hypothetical protein
MSASVPVRPWKESFDVYFRHTEEGPHSVLLDMEAVRHAPLASHPVVWRLTLPLKFPTPNGLRQAEEKDAVFAVQDALEARLLPLGLLPVGHIVGHGLQALFLYGPESVTPEQVLPIIRAHQRDYDVGVARALDPDWNEYRQVLYPPPLQRHLMANYHLVAELQKQGDRVDLPRVVDHHASFPEEDPMKAAEGRLKNLGFRGFKRQPPSEPGGPWGLDFHRRDPVDEARANASTEAIVRVTDAHGGTYDGWGCQVVKERSVGQWLRGLVGMR